MSSTSGRSILIAAALVVYFAAGRRGARHPFLLAAFIATIAAPPCSGWNSGAYAPEYCHHAGDTGCRPACYNSGVSALVYPVRQCLYKQAAFLQERLNALLDTTLIWLHAAGTSRFERLPARRYLNVGMARSTWQATPTP
ncbi:MAG: hypothetical protein H6994_00780 [Pseudomonadales bacterium]|nr:hypothetical protein [Pseudomonadales bacterium]